MMGNIGVLASDPFRPRRRHTLTLPGPRAGGPVHPSAEPGRAPTVPPGSPLLPRRPAILQKIQKSAIRMAVLSEKTHLERNWLKRGRGRAVTELSSRESL